MTWPTNTGSPARWPPYRITRALDAAELYGPEVASSVLVFGHLDAN
ncbi:hypothetical protein ACFVX3_19770 [Rhodococcus erythropolis]